MKIESYRDVRNSIISAVVAGSIVLTANLAGETKGRREVLNDLEKKAVLIYWKDPETNTDNHILRTSYGSFLLQEKREVHYLQEFK